MKKFFKSIRFQVILLYLLILTLTLTIFSLFLYFDYQDILNDKVDAVLRSKADGIENSIRTYWQAGKVEMTQDWSQTHLFSKSQQREFKQIADTLTTEQLSHAESIPTLIFIFDSKGSLIASSGNVFNLKPLQKRVLMSARSRGARLDSFRLIPGQKDKPVFVRALTKPIIERGNVEYVVQVMASLAPMENELRGLKGAFFFRVPIVLLIAILAALFLVRVTLSPIDEMVSIIGSIKPDNLKLRINVPKTGDEIERLAKTFNEMLREMDRSFTAQRQIVRDISHELKTPLTILQGQHEVALRRNRSQAEYKELLYSNLEEIERMRRIINNLLLLATFDKKAVLLEKKSIDLNKLLKEALDHFKTQARIKEIKVEFIESTKIILTGDEVYLRLMFMSLIDNAVKFTSDHGKVAVRISQYKQFARIDITDTGQGIPREELPLIFDRFYKVDKARSSNEGFGLSLSIVKCILEVHKGDVQIQSQLGKGATFTVFLPFSSN